MHFQKLRSGICIDANRMIGNADFLIMLFFIQQRSTRFVLGRTAVFEYILFALVYNVLYIINDTHDRDQHRGYIRNASTKALGGTVICSLLVPFLYFAIRGGTKVFVLLPLLSVGLLHTYVVMCKPVTVLLLQWLRIFFYGSICGITDPGVIAIFYMLKILTYYQYYVSYKGYNRKIYAVFCAITVLTAVLFYQPENLQILLSLIPFLLIHRWAMPQLRKVDLLLHMPGIHRWIPACAQTILLIFLRNSWRITG